MAPRARKAAYLRIVRSLGSEMPVGTDCGNGNPLLEAVIAIAPQLQGRATELVVIVSLMQDGSIRGRRLDFAAEVPPTDGARNVLLETLFIGGGDGSGLRVVAVDGWERRSLLANEGRLAPAFRAARRVGRSPSEVSMAIPDLGRVDVSLCRCRTIRGDGSRRAIGVSAARPKEDSTIKRVLASATAALLSTLVPSAAPETPATDVARLEVVNTSAASVYYLRISPCHAESWGRHQLDDDDVSCTNGSRRWHMDGGCYDVRVELSGGRGSVDWRGLELTPGGMTTLVVPTVAAVGNATVATMGDAE